MNESIEHCTTENAMERLLIFLEWFGAPNARENLNEYLKVTEPTTLIYPFSTRTDYQDNLGRRIYEYWVFTVYIDNPNPLRVGYPVRG